MRSGGLPASVRACESAIEKQDACAAASSSSGFVVFSVPNERAFHVSGKVAVPEESSTTVPSPSSSAPFHTAVDSLVTGMASSLWFGASSLAMCVGRWQKEGCVWLECGGGPGGACGGGCEVAFPPTEKSER